MVVLKGKSLWTKSFVRSRVGFNKLERVEFMPGAKSETDLIRWNAPFADWSGICVKILTEADAENFIIVVEPWPRDHYPKYLVRFESIIEIKTYDEALCAFEARLTALTGWIHGVKAYEWSGSTSAQLCRKYAEFRTWAEPRHYLIIGEDSTVEVISSHEPKIERVDAKRFIDVRHEI